MLGALVGIKAMLIYVSIAFLCAVFFGWGLQKVDAQSQEWGEVQGFVQTG